MNTIEKRKGGGKKTNQNSKTYNANKRPLPPHPPLFYKKKIIFKKI